MQASQWGDTQAQRIAQWLQDWCTLGLREFHWWEMTPNNNMLTTTTTHMEFSDSGWFRNWISQSGTQKQNIMSNWTQTSVSTAINLFMAKPKRIYSSIYLSLAEHSTKLFINLSVISRTLHRTIHLSICHYSLVEYSKELFINLSVISRTLHITIHLSICH